MDDFGILIFIFVMFFMLDADAQTCESKIVKEATPKVFQDSGVTRKLKDGTVQKFDGDKYKIVPRTQKRTKCKSNTVYVKETRTIIKRKRNRLQLFLGNGPSDSLLTRKTGPLSVQVQSEDENLLGLGYSREIIDINEDVSLTLGGQYFTNETLTLSVGLSW